MLVGIGMVVGLAIGAWASRFVATLLYGLEPSDPGTLVASATTLGAHWRGRWMAPGATGPHASTRRESCAMGNTSAPPRGLDGGDVDLLHRHHRLEGTLCLTATSRKRVG